MLSISRILPSGYVRRPNRGRSGLMHSLNRLSKEMGYRGEINSAVEKEFLRRAEIQIKKCKEFKNKALTQIRL